MTQAYLYRWTEKATGMWYIGSRYAKNSHPSDGYICSSKIVKPMIIANPEGWEKQILVIGNPTDIRELEAKYLLSLSAASDLNSYNKHNGNKNFHTCGIPRSDKQKAFLLENNPSKRQEVKEKLRIATKSRDNSHLHTKEAREKASESQKLAWAEGKFKGVGFKSGDDNVAKNKEVREKISLALKNIKGGRMTGKVHSDETKKKMAESRFLYWQKKRSNAGQNYL